MEGYCRMIFFIWFTYSLITTATIPQFIFPFLALFTRSTYYDRKLRIFRYSHLLMIGFMLIAALFSDFTSLDQVIMNLLKVIGFMIFFYQVSIRIIEMPTSITPKKFKSLFVFIIKEARFTKDKIVDFQFNINDRINSRTGNSISNLLLKIKLSLRSLLPLFVDTIRIERRKNTIISARGGLPKTDIWETNKAVSFGFLWIVLADILFISLISLLMVSTSNNIAPSFVLKYVVYFKSIIGL